MGRTVTRRHGSSQPSPSSLISTAPDSETRAHCPAHAVLSLGRDLLYKGLDGLPGLVVQEVYT